MPLSPLLASVRVGTPLPCLSELAGPRGGEFQEHWGEDRGSLGTRRGWGGAEWGGGGEAGGASGREWERGVRRKGIDGKDAPFFPSSWCEMRGPRVQPGHQGSCSRRAAVLSGKTPRPPGFPAGV